MVGVSVESQSHLPTMIFCRSEDLALKRPYTSMVKSVEAELKMDVRSDIRAASITEIMTPRIPAVSSGVVREGAGREWYRVPVDTVSHSMATISSGGEGSPTQHTLGDSVVKRDSLSVSSYAVEN